MTKQTAASTQVAILKEQNPNKNSPKTGKKRKAQYIKFLFYNNKMIENTIDAI